MGQGTWKKAGNSYELTFPTTSPNTVSVAPADDGTFKFPWDGHILIFNKEM